MKNILRYQYGPFRYKNVTFKEVPSQWHLLYLYFWECDMLFYGIAVKIPCKNFFRV